MKFNESALLTSYVFFMFYNFQRLDLHYKNEILYGTILGYYFCGFNSGFIKNHPVTSIGYGKSLLTATGSTSYSMIPRAHLMVVLSAEKYGQPIELMEAYGGLGQLEDNFDNPQIYFEKIDEHVQHLFSKVDGVYAEAGERKLFLGR